MTFSLRISSLAVTLIAACASSASAAYVYSLPVGGSNDYLIASTNGTLLASGYAGAGFFTLSDSQVADLAAAKDYGDLFAAFQPIGRTDNFIDGGITFAGTPVPGFYYTASGDFEVTPQVAGHTLYTLLSDNGISSLVTSFALFQSGLTLAVDPSQPGIPNTYYIYPSDSTILAGAHGPGLYSPVAEGTYDTFKLVPVPEPSSFAVVITGLALASLRRRR